MDTTLQRLTDLEGSVTKLEQGLVKVQGDVQAVKPVADINAVRVQVANSTVVDVKGKGRLFAAYFPDGAWGCTQTLDVYIDGVKQIGLKTQKNIAAGCFVYMQDILGDIPVGFSTTTDNYMLFTYSQMLMDFKDVRYAKQGEPIVDSQKLNISSAPFSFEESLKVLHSTTDKVASNNSPVLIAYTLDQ